MTLTANSLGQIQGQFTIPAGVPSGSKLVEFVGAATTANATFVGRGVLKIEELRRVSTLINRRTLTWYGDPLAQTFIVDRTRQVAAVDLWFTAKGGTNVLVQIRDVQIGIPNADVVAEAILTPAEIKTNDFTRFRFPPALLDAGREYAIVIACDDATTAVAIAELGKFDAAQQRWVTSQPYTVGVLLSSSNNRTWTAHQDKDLAFRLVAADYNVVTNTHYEGSTSRVVALDPVAVVDADHLIVLAAAERPTEQTDVVFDLSVGGTIYTVTEGQRLTLPTRFSGNVSISARLSGTYDASPTLYRDVQLVVGTRQGASEYITRAMTAEGGTTITVYYEAITPGTATVLAQAENGTGVWVDIPVVAGTPIGNDWVEVKRVLTEFEQPETRIRLTLTGSAKARPRVRNLRVAIT